ncbi:MAG TPA: IPT/TIG domain-containing protein, partial [Pyrinomonadaceae bacterium]|nr:IPT/TIG domain-containing protein [Pyrinomonadaceae bacterium]
MQTRVRTRQVAHTVTLVTCTVVCLFLATPISALLVQSRRTRSKYLPILSSASDSDRVNGSKVQGFSVERQPAVKVVPKGDSSSYLGSPANALSPGLLPESHYSSKADAETASHLALAAPNITTLSPSSAIAGGAGFDLVVNGTGFVDGFVIRINSLDRTTTFIDSTQLSTPIDASEITTAGSLTVTVFDPDVNGGESAPLTLPINNPVPSTSTLSPASATAGGPTFPLTVNGSNFVTGATVNFGATPHTATVISSGQLTASISASEITTAGAIIPVTITNPSPGGGTSTPALNFTVNHPVPVITSLSPTAKTAGDPAFTLTVNGSSFESTSVVRFNGSTRTTAFINSNQLTAQILASDLTAVGSFPITVFNSAPGGGTSNAVNFTVSSVPVPTITTLVPTSVTAGGPDFTLTVNGTNFVVGSVVRFNGTNRTTTFVSSTQLTATILAPDIALAGGYPITVLNPAPGGGTSGAVILAVNPVITTISPATVRAGDIGFTLTVNGIGFVTGTVVRFNGANRSTTFLSSTQLTASISGTDIATVGTYPITVVTPAPASLVSNAVNITAIPSITNLTPMTAVIGDPGFTLTVIGSGFVNGAVVKWNGVNKTTSFVNSSKLTATIAAADISTVGPRAVTVLNPAPTNLTSNAVNFNVTNPPPATECAADVDVTLADPGLINSGPARSQMWRNDNIWWGAFSNNTDGVYFYRQMTPTTWSRGTLIDANFVAGVFVAGAPDCLWNGTNLFILIQESITLAKLYKYTYSTTTKTYTLVSGFPISLPLIGVGTSGSGKAYGTLAIDQDSTGKLWAAYTGSGMGGDGNIRVISSTSVDHKTWDTTGFVLASGVSVNKTEGSTIVRFGNKIGVAWSNLNTSENAFRFHNDGDPVTTWSLKEVIDSGLGPEGTGSVAGKQMSMKAHPDGRIFMVSDDNDGINNHLHIYVRTAVGVWGQKTLVVNDFSAMPSKPVLLLDTDNSTIHVIYKDNAIASNGLGGQTFITQASMSSPAFNSSCVLIDTSEDTTLSTSNPTSTKQNLTATTDLVVAGSTGKAGNHILTNYVDLTPNQLTLFSISPKEVTAGEAGFTMTVNGKLFVNGAVVKFNGSSRTTTYLNAGKLTASILNTNIAAAGSYPITVTNPDNSVSNAKNLLVTATNPVPVVNLITPKREPVGTPQITMTVIGTGFRRSSVVRFNGVNKTTSYVSDTQLTATILASDMLVPGPFPITVFNPTPGGGTSTIKKATTFYVEPACPTTSPQSFTGVTVFNTNKAQMWYNDSLWWSALSDNTSGIYFYKQSGSTFIKGALLDTNLNGRPDVLWNGTNLFVLVYEFNTQARLYKYTYNSVTKTYAIVSGFPVTLPLIGIGTGTTESQTGSITFAQDSTGKLWATYPGTGPGGDGNYRVIWSTSADHKIWDTNGFILATGGATATQEVTNIVHFGGNKIGVAWSHQLAPIEDAFRYHLDGDPENVWSTKEVIDSGLGNELGQGGVADNHGSMKAAPDGRIFLVAKDSDGVGYLHLYTRTTAGVWSANPVLVDIDPHAATTRPTLLLDLENSEVYVFYEDATESLMFLGHTDMNTPAFGPPCPWISPTYVVDITSTKQNLRSSMGLQAVASTGGPTSAIFSHPVTLAAGSGNPPVLSSISPLGVGQNTGPATITLNGSNFATGAVVYFNGMDRATTFVSSTQLTATLLATDSLTLGTYPITVMNPKGGSSAPANLIVGAVITNLQPTTATAGDGGFTLTVNGIGFVSGAAVTFNGISRAATFINSAQLTTQIQASDIQTYGNYPVTVVNPSGNTSPPSTFVVSNTLPTITAISPSIQNVGTGAFTLSVTGTNFNSSSIVSFNGLVRTTSLVSSTQLTAQILAGDIASAGNFPISVFNPAPGGGTSAAIPLTVVNPVPAISSLSPPTAIVGAGGFTLTVNGSAFVNGSVVRFNGSDRATTFVNSTKLTAQINAADVLATGTFPITVFNPLPGGGISNASDLAVNNPVPTVTTISPSTKLAGDAAFVLTVNGTNFNNSSVVRFNGSDRLSTLVSSTQMTAQITAADVVANGLFPITVFNSLPGGGGSNAVNLTVNNPVPSLSNISPTNKIAGDADFVLTVNGTNFNSSSVVRFNGSSRPTTLVSSTQLTAQITAADVQTGGTFP